MCRLCWLSSHVGLIHLTYNIVTKSWHFVVLTSAHMEVSDQCNARTSLILCVCLDNNVGLIYAECVYIHAYANFPNEMTI